MSSITFVIGATASGKSFYINEMFSQEDVDISLLWELHVMLTRESQSLFSISTVWISTIIRRITTQVLKGRT